MIDKNLQGFEPWLQKCTNGGSNYLHFYLRSDPLLDPGQKPQVKDKLVYPQEVYGEEDEEEQLVNFDEIYTFKTFMSIRKVSVI